MEAENRNTKNPNDIKDFLNKLKKIVKANKKTVIALGSMGAAIIVLVIISATLRQPATFVLPENPVGNELLDSAMMAKQKAQKDILGPREEDGPAPQDRDKKALPAPDFVTSNRDTLIWQNGIYKRVGTLKPLNEPKDTVEIDGRKYIREDIIERTTEDKDTISVKTDISITENADTTSQSGGAGPQGR